jgi:hypothetical protein
VADARNLGIARVHERHRLGTIASDDNGIAPRILPPRNEDQSNLGSEMRRESIE